MLYLLSIQNVAWVLSQTGISVLLFFLFRSGNYKKYPLFTSYQIANLAQAAVLLLTYRAVGRSSHEAFLAYWTTQGFVLALRGLAVAELCRGMLGRFTGIWTLSSRVLLVCTAGIIGYAAAVSDWRGDWAVTAASRGLELAVAGVVVTLFLFSHYYQVPYSRQNRALAAGFCIYSCTVVLHNTFGNTATPILFILYDIAAMLVFCVSLTIWSLALRFPAPAQEEIPALLADDSYQQLSPAINARLRMLNDRLISAWKVETPQP
jgi:hypothetical protein